MVLEGAVINLTDRPPPNALDGGAAFACTTSAVKGQEVLIKIQRACSYAGFWVDFHSDTSVLAEICKSGPVQEVLDAFISGDPDMLPSGNLKQLMESIAGITSTGRKPVDLKHLPPAGDLVFEIVRRKDVGSVSKERLLIESIDPTTFFMQNEYDVDPYRGNQHPAFKYAVVRDLFDVGCGCAIMGPTYKWLQYVADVPEGTLQRLFYDRPLHGVEDDGTKIGDVLQIDAAIQRPLSIISGRSDVQGHDIVLCGAKGGIPVRTWMGISFSLNSSGCPQAIREVVSGSFNPSLETCHGFVIAVADSPEKGGGVLLSVRIVLTRDNLPSYLKWPVLPRDAVFQTNLQANIQSSCVRSSFKILPLPLYVASGLMPEEKGMQLGLLPPRPIERDVYVAGHLEFTKGNFIYDENHMERPQAASGPQNFRGWSKRHEDPNYMHFALLNDWCARGGKIIDGDFQSHHAPWKERYLEETSRHQGGRYLPKVTLFPVDAFTPELALSTISECAMLPTQLACCPLLFALHAAIRRYAVSKTKRVKGKLSGSVSIDANIPGSALLQLVHKFISESKVKVQFKEGAVEAIIQNLDDAEKLIGVRDGTFDFGGAGGVRFCGPMTCRWVLYEPKKSPEDSLVSFDGKAEVLFGRYVTTDRHGAPLKGDMDGSAPRSPVSKGDGNGGGEGGGEGGEGGDRSREDDGSGESDGRGKRGRWTSSTGERQASSASLGLLCLPPHVTCPPQGARKEVESLQGHFLVRQAHHLPSLSQPDQKAASLLNPKACTSRETMFPVKGAAAEELDILSPRRKVKVKHRCWHHLVYSCSLPRLLMTLAHYRWRWSSLSRWSRLRRRPQESTR